MNFPRACLCLYLPPVQKTLVWLPVLNKIISSLALTSSFSSIYLPETSFLANGLTHNFLIPLPFSSLWAYTKVPTHIDHSPLPTHPSNFSPTSMPDEILPSLQCHSLPQLPFPFLTFTVYIGNFIFISSL